MALVTQDTTDMTNLALSGTLSVAGTTTLTGAVALTGAQTVDSIAVGGGYSGGSGATISTAGVGQFNGALTTDGALTAGSAVIGGGYGSTGATISAAGVGQFNGALTTDGALTADSGVFGGGYGATGATISNAGVGQFNGALTTDGLLTCAGVTTSAPVTHTQTVATAALGTVRGVYGNMTASGTDISGGNLVGIRGLVTLSGTITAGGPYLYGAQGKLAITGTMNHADSRLCAVLAQLDTTGATLTDGQLSALWVDHGAGITGAGGGQFNMVRITNTVSGSKPNAIIYAHSDATYAFDFSGPGGTTAYIATAGTSSGSFGNADGVASKVLLVNVGGTTYYIPMHTQNT